MSHFSCLVIMPEGSTIEDVELHISAFCNGYIMGDYDENYENPYAFYDYARIMPFPIWNTDEVLDEGAGLGEYTLTCAFMADTPFPKKRYSWEYDELWKVSAKYDFDNDFILETVVKIEKKTFQCNTIVSPTGLVYTWDDYENKEDFYTLCTEMYNQYRDGYIVYGFDCHS